MKVRGWLIVGMLAFVIAGTGCSRADPSIIAQAGGDGNGAEDGAIQVAASETALDYEQDELQAPADTEFVVNFINPSATPHNWVLVEPGQEQPVADAAAQQEGEAVGLEEPIAATEVIAGTNQEITVGALAAGEYSYICTVPGHYAAGMAGTLIVGEP